MASEVQTAVTQNVTFTTVQSGSDRPSALGTRGLVTQVPGIAGSRRVRFTHHRPMYEGAPGCRPCLTISAGYAEKFVYWPIF